MSILEYGLIATALQYLISDAKGPWDMLVHARGFMPDVVQAALRCERCTGFWVGVGLGVARLAPVWSAPGGRAGQVIASGLAALVLVGVGRSLMNLGATTGDGA